MAVNEVPLMVISGQRQIVHSVPSVYRDLRHHVGLHP